MTVAVTHVPVMTRAAIFLRLLAIQASWNYETLIGNGIGFTVEPALRLLPGGVDGDAYRSALARQSQYFNAHPYTASVAVGALARSELDGVEPARIERFRTALCGPLGGIGDRLVWAAWLPLSALLALLAFGLGAGPGATLLVFLGVYNVGHLALRLWGLEVGLRHGMRVAQSLGHPVLRSGPQYLSRAGALLAGMAIPLAIQRSVAQDGRLLVALLLMVCAGGIAVSRLRGRYEIWKWSLAALALIALYSVLR
jgi:mannose/fructose/N-acetylgalactosamine-specific phosphotransferase system component IID